jgi:hypothetical protein
MPEALSAPCRIAQVKILTIDCNFLKAAAGAGGHCGARSSTQEARTLQEIWTTSWLLDDSIMENVVAAASAL